MPGDPDLRTAAQALLDTVDMYGECPFCGSLDEEHQDVCPGVPLRAALAAEATEPPPYTVRVSTSGFCTCGHEHRQHDIVRGCSWLACECPRFEGLKGEPNPAPAPGPQGADERLLAEIDQRRSDPEFMGRIAASIERNREVLDRLAAGAGTPDEPGDDDHRPCDGPTDYTDPSTIDVDVVIGNINHAHRIRGHMWTDERSWPNVTVKALADEVERLRAAAPASEDDELQRRAGAWHRARFPEAEQHHVALKAVEELGEVAEAANAIAGVNSATANGALSVPAEAADVVIALMVLLDRWHTADLLTEVATKLLILEDPGSGHRSAARRVSSGSPPPTPGPTREDVWRVVNGLFWTHELVSRAWAAGAEEPTPEALADRFVDEAADAVMALLSTPATVLARLVTYDSIEGPDQSVVPSIVIPHPPGTHVQVVADTEDPTGVQDPISNIGGGTSTPDDANAGLHAPREWCGLNCSFCGHWAKGRFTKDQVAEWLRTHKAAGITPNEGHTTTESTCPHPCGTHVAVTRSEP